MVGLAQPLTVDHHLVSGPDAGMGLGSDGTGQIRARDQRETFDDRDAVGKGKAILVVDGGVLDVDGDVTVHQIVSSSSARSTEKVSSLLVAKSALKVMCDFSG